LINSAIFHNFPHANTDTVADESDTRFDRYK